MKALVWPLATYGCESWTLRKNEHVLTTLTWKGWCMQARKTTHGLDGQPQYVDKTPRERVDQNDRGQR